MAIKGSLKEASLTDVLQLLSMGGKTGCLAVTNGSKFGYIYFSDGRIIYASLLNRRDRLGDTMVRDGVITEEQIDEALDEQARSRDAGRVGEILKRLCFIDQETLERYVRAQIQEAIYHLFTWNRGSFYFEPGQLPDGEPIQVSMDPESLLLEGARRIDEWSQIKNKIPSFDLIFSLDTDRSASLTTLDLTKEQKDLLPYLDGKHSVWGVIEETGLTEFEVGRALYGLISVGLARRSCKQEGDARQSDGPSHVEERRNLGVAFYKTAMFDEALREFKAVLELDPEAIDAEFYLGGVALQRGDLEMAATHFRRVLDLGATRPAVFNNLALTIEKLGDPEEALHVLKEGQQRTGGHPKLDLSMAIILLKLGDPAAAATSLEKYRGLVEGEPPPLFYSALALTEAMLGDLDSAVKTAEAAVKKFPASAALVNNAGVICERKGDFERAKQLYEQALGEEFALAQASKNFGDMLYREGAYEEAATAYERALRSDPELGDDVYAKLGNVYYKNRDRSKAVEMWIRALELNPSNEVVRTNLELVKGADGDS